MLVLLVRHSLYSFAYIHYTTKLTTIFKRLYCGLTLLKHTHMENLKNQKEIWSFIVIAAGVLIIFLDLYFLVRNSINLWHLLTALEKKVVITFETLFFAGGLALILYALVPRTGDESVAN